MNDIVVKKANSPYIFSFPHSGQMLVGNMDWQLRPESLKFLPNMDWHLNELYSFLENYNVNIVSTPHSRYVVDVNRPPDVQKLGGYRNSLVYNKNTWDEEIYAIEPSEEDVDRRIRRYYEPYHQELEALIEEKAREFGKVYLIDIHSFMGPIVADVCLGNRHNVTSTEAFIDKVYEAFSSEGFHTVKNDVFIGGYITKNYAIKGMVETLQIELRYSNYIEAHELDKRVVPNKNSTLFYETALRLEGVIQKMGIEKRENQMSLSISEEGNVLHGSIILSAFVLMIILMIFTWINGTVF